MAMKYIILISICITSCIGHESCPDPKEFLPCTCDGEGVNCMGNITVTELLHSFRVKFPYGGARALWMQNTNISSLPNGLFGDNTFLAAFVEYNHLTSASPNAFNGSSKTLQLLSFFGNEINSFSFSELNSFDNLIVLNLGRNKLTTIPSDAFAQNSMLQKVILAQNKITTIGEHAFYGPTDLREIHLSQNSLKILTDYSFTIKPPIIGVTEECTGIDLSHNNITTIGNQTFYNTSQIYLSLEKNQLKELHEDVFAPLVNKMVQSNKGMLNVKDNPLSCCGHQYLWLISNKFTVSTYIQDFECPDGRGIEQLEYEDYECKETF